jgi:hypothetical protein
MASPSVGPTGRRIPCWFLSRLLRLLSIFLMLNRPCAVTSFVPITRRPPRPIATTTTAWSSSSSRPDDAQPVVIVVGKIIVDEYGDPEKERYNSNVPNITVGGGGPQAAMGAALALAARSLLLLQQSSNEIDLDGEPPPKQPCNGVSGQNDWGDRDPTDDATFGIGPLERLEFLCCPWYADRQFSMMGTEGGPNNHFCRVFHRPIHPIRALYWMVVVSFTVASH